jgi:hypothetical protein
LLARRTGRSIDPEVMASSLVIEKSLTIRLIRGF